MDLVALEEAHASGADVNMKMDGGWTVLHLAAKRADIKMARMLILWDADLDAKSMNGTTPLHMAANYGFLSFAMLLVVSGASVEPKDIQNFTPLHFAAYCNRRQEYDLANVRAGGLTFAESAPSGDVPGLGANAAFPAGVFPNYLGVVELLIHNGAAPSPVTIYQETPLHYVSTFDCYSIGQYLIGQGANINYQDIQGETPLHEAVAYGALGTTEVSTGTLCSEIKHLAQCSASQQPNSPECAHVFATLSDTKSSLGSQELVLMLLGCLTLVPLFCVGRL